MRTVRMTAEISERNINGKSRVIRIHLPNGHYYTRTCKLDRYSRIKSHRANFNPAKERGLPLNSEICSAIKEFANSFGKDGEYFSQFASRTKTLYITETHSRRTSNEEAGAFLAGVAVYAIASAILKSSK